MSEFEVIINGMRAQKTAEGNMESNLNQILQQIEDMINAFSKEGECVDDIRSSLVTVKSELSDETADMGRLKGTLDQIISYYLQTEKKLIGAEGGDKKKKEEDNPLLEKLKDLIRKLLGLSPDCCVFGGDPVNLCTGNFIYHREDLKVKGKFPLCFERYYNGMDTKKTVMSNGWHHNYEIYLKEAGDSLILHLGDGGEEKFVLSENGTQYDSIFGSYQHMTKTSEGYLYHDKKGRCYYFDENGLLMSIKDSNGNEISFAYEKGYLTRVTNAVGNTLTYQYNDENQLVKVSDHAGRHIQLFYSEGMLVKVIGLDQAKLCYAYNQEGLIQAITNPNGVTIVQNEYDDKKRVIRQVYPDEGVMTYEYQDEQGNVIVTQQNGEKITYIHDEKYRHIGTLTSEGMESYTYNELNRKTSFTDRRGNVTHFNYDNRGNVTSVIDPMGNKSFITYDINDKPLTIKRKDGAVFAYHYNEAGNVVQSIDGEEHKTTISYEKKGLPTRVELPDHSVLRLAYDEQGNLCRITDACGNVTDYEYDESHRVIHTRDGNQNDISFSYDESGNITQVKNAAGDVKRYRYNKTGKVCQITDFNGTSQEWQYNELNKVALYRDQNGNETNYKYNKMWDLISCQRANGALVQYEYDKASHLSAVVNPYGAKVRYFYDVNGQCTKVIGDHGEVTEFIYDSLGRNIEIIDTEGNKIRKEYDAMDRIIKETDPQGGVTTFKYNKMGQMTEAVNPLNQVTSYCYNALGLLEKVTDQTGRPQIYEYWPGGKLKTLTDQRGNKLSFYYDPNGNLTRKCVNDDYEIIYEYNALNQVVRMKSSCDQDMLYTYDAVGNITSMTDANGNVTKYTYSPTGKVLEVEDAAGGHVSYEYDEMDQIISISEEGSEIGKDKLPGNVLDSNFDGDLAEEEKMLGYCEAEKNNGSRQRRRLTTYQRNLLGKVEVVENALGQKESYEYDKAGYLIRKTLKNGHSMEYGYNGRGQLREIHFQDGREVKFSYSPLAQLEEMKDWLGITRIEHDALGREKKIVDPKGNAVEYEWGNAGERLRTVYPDGSAVNYEYDDDYYLIGMDSEAGHIAYAYDAAGNLSEKLYPNGIRTNYQYNIMKQVTGIIHENQQGILDEFEYKYDKMGNRIEVNASHREGGMQPEKWNYEYDPLGRLIGTVKDGEAVRSYQYDQFGNRISMNEGKKKISYQYNELNQLISLGEYEQEAGSVLQKYFKYDDNGNLTAVFEDGRLKLDLEYNDFNRLSHVKRADGREGSYVYNGLGQRMEAAYDNRQYEYILDLTRPYDNMLGRKSQGKLEKYIWDDHVTGRIDTEGKVGYLLQDVMGSTIRLMADEGKTREVYRYDEFGETEGMFEEKKQAFGYAGYQFEPLMGMYNVQARNYMPDLGRFNSEDIMKGISTESQTRNEYLYALNNPLKYYDPSGNVTKEEGTAAHRALQAYYNYLYLPSSGHTGKTEYYIPTGCEYAGEYYTNMSGIGYADIAMYQNNTTAVSEIYEIKPLNYYEIIRGHEQLEAYSNGFQTSWQYTPSRGTTFNPNHVVIENPLDDKTYFVYSTYYGSDPGMIYYEIKSKDDIDNDKDNKYILYDQKDNSEKEIGGQENNSQDSDADDEEDDDQVAAASGWRRAGAAGLALLSAFGLVALTADDATGIGAADDGLIAPTAAELLNELSILFTGYGACLY